MAKKIVVLGAGFAGLKATRTLSKALKGDGEITLIDRHSYHTMMTQLHEVAAGRVPFTNAQYDLARLLGRKKNVNLVTDEVTTIDKETKTVETSNGSYSYDYLVVAIGAEPNDFGIPGVKKYGYTLCSIEDALRIKRHLEEIVQRASTELNPEKRKAMLNISVAGSGFTGIEMAGELIEWRDVAAREWKIDPKDFTLNIIEMMPTILNTLDRKQADKAMKYLKKNGVNILTSHTITELQANSVKIKGGKDIPTYTLIWTTGVQGNTQANAYQLAETERGHRLLANEYMQAVGFEDKGIYVAGDISGYIAPDADGAPTPQIVEAAEQTAHTAAENIIADIKGTEKKKFIGKYSGTMVSVGSRYAVAHIFDKVRLSGFFAMFMKNFIYIIYTLQIGSLWYFFTYLKNEFFHTSDGRNLFRGHSSRLGNVLWSFPLRLFYGFCWLLDAIPKIWGDSSHSWLGDDMKISTFMTSAGGWIERPSTVAAGASAAEAVAGASGVEATAGASGAAADAAVRTVWSLTYEYGTFPQPTTNGVPGWLQPIIRFFVPNYETALLLQKIMTFVELFLAVAIIVGAFTWIASAGTAVLTVVFASTGMLTWISLWFIPVAIALMNGSGRAFGLDKWIQPWIQRRFFRVWYAKSNSIYPTK